MCPYGWPSFGRKKNVEREKNRGNRQKREILKEEMSNGKMSKREI
jgi:hypothetical protein